MKKTHVITNSTTKNWGIIKSNMLKGEVILIRRDWGGNAWISIPSDQIEEIIVLLGGE